MNLRRRLFTKYAFVMVALVGTVLALAAATQMALTYRAQMRQVGEVMRAEAALAAEKIGTFVAGIVASIGTLSDFDQPGAPADLQEVRAEAYRVMRRQDAVIRLMFVDGRRCRGVIVSRLAPDIEIDCERNPVEAAKLLPSEQRFRELRARQVTYSEVYRPDGSEPHMNITLSSRGERTGIVDVQVDIRRIHETVAAIRIGQAGIAFVVDERRRLIAHPDMSLALRQMTITPPAEATSSDERYHPALVSDGTLGERVLTRWSPVGRPAWHVVVEQPASEALRPVYVSLFAALAVFLASILIAIAASFALARHLARPILAVRQGAARIGGGDFSARIVVDTGDEVGLLADEFNRMAERLQESRATLERRVADRTAELALRTQEADNANAAKTRFLASASHDLRQPMHAISLLVGLLHERSRDATERQLVDKVQASVQAMESLFSGLLDISKLDAGAVKPNEVAFEIDGVLRQVELQCAPQAHEKGIVLRVRHSSAVVRSDPVLIERIAINLVTNAIRYTERGKVLVGCRRLGDRVRLLILDTGVGIAPEHLDSVFEEFFQLPHTERDRSKGLGLGLSIVMRSAALLGHPLIVRSRPGHGSVFGVELPRVAAPARTEQPGAALLAGGLDGAFVVVIDDDREGRGAMELLFRQWGCHVVSADSDEAALQALQGHLRTPDLIVTDYRLRDAKSGLAAIRRLRDHAGQEVPAIVVTGDVFVADPGDPSLNGVVVMHKPVNFERLRTVAVELATRGQEAT